MIAANKDGASDLGVDYAFMTMMTLSPDFAAANYTVSNPDGTDVLITIGRLPYNYEIFKNNSSNLKLEMAVARQKTTETIKTFPLPNEKIDAEWNTTGIGAGLLYQHTITDYLEFTPSLRYGLARMENNASYHGPLTQLIKDYFEGTLLNWKTNASMINLGLGLNYHWQILDRHSNIRMNYYHHLVESYNESNAAVQFRETADMLTTTADMIFPTGLFLHDRRLDFILLLGKTNYLGKNRNTLGHSASYMAGFGSELPLKWQQNITGYLRLSYQVLWADNLKGWLLTIGYNPI
ncbi:hypothetical protein [Kaarinaea lacus]